MSVTQPGACQVVVLAGTGEARHFCQLLAGRGLSAMASLAGVTQAPLDYPVPTRSGGFGGIEGYSNWLDVMRPKLVVDALHPFAGTMRQRVLDVAEDRSETVLHLSRPPWTAQQGDKWLRVDSLAEAARVLPPEAVPLLTTGRGGWDHFATRIRRGYLRSIEPIEGLPSNITPLIDRPPFSLDAEIDLMRDLGVTHLVTKNAGGPHTQAKLRAAHRLGLPVVMVSRPKFTSPHAKVHSADAALAFCDMALDLTPGSA